MKTFRWKKHVPFFVIALSVALAFSAEIKESATWDEVVYLPNGLNVLTTGQFSTALFHPPVPLLLPALPLHIMGHTRDIFDNPGKIPKYYNWAFQLSRCVSILFLALSLWLVYAFAQELYGSEAGLLALGLAAFNPNLLAHGAFITPDIYVTAGLLGSLYLLERFLRKPHPKRAFVLGAVMGFSFVSKVTCLALAFFVPLLCFLFPVFRRLTWRKKWTAVGIILFTSFAVVHLAYGFQGSFDTWGSLAFKSSAFLKLQHTLPRWMPTFFPSPYLLSTDLQMSLSPIICEFLGKSGNGTAWYYVLALLVKTPEVLLLIPALVFWADSQIKPREMPYLVVGLIFFLMASYHTTRQIGLRYVLFAYPLMAIWSGRIVQTKFWRRRYLKKYALPCLLLIAALGAFVTWPTYLSYFNPTSGGARNGHRYLGDSNTDWGQGLTGLNEFLRKSGASSVGLIYFGLANPEGYGIHAKTGFHLNERFFAVSANYVWSDFLGQQSGIPQTLKLLRTIEPAAVLMESIYVYDLKAPTFPRDAIERTLKPSAQH